MTKQDLNRAKDAAESFTEDLLLWVVGLPKPFTFLVVVSVLGAAFVAGLVL